MKVINFVDRLRPYLSTLTGQRRVLLEYIIRFPEYAAHLVGVLPKGLYAAGPATEYIADSEAKRIVEWIKSLDLERVNEYIDYIDDMIDLEKKASVVKIKMPTKENLEKKLEKDLDKQKELHREQVRRYFELMFGKAYGDAIATLASVNPYRIKQAADDEGVMDEQIQQLLSALTPTKEYSGRNDVVDDNPIADLTALMNKENSDDKGESSGDNGELSGEESLNVDTDISDQSNTSPDEAVQNLPDLSHPDDLGGSLSSEAPSISPEDFSRLVKVVKDLLKIFTYFYSNYNADKKRLVTVESRLMKLYDVVSDLARTVKDVVERFVGSYTKLPVESSNAADVFLGAANLAKNKLAEVGIPVELEYDGMSITKTMPNGVPLAGVVNIRATFFDPYHRIEKVMRIPVYILEGFYEEPRFGIDEYGTVIPLTRKGISEWMGISELDAYQLESPVGESSAFQYPQEYRDVFNQSNPYSMPEVRQVVPEQNYRELYHDTMSETRYNVWGPYDYPE